MRRNRRAGGQRLELGVAFRSGLIGTLRLHALRECR
jgi:hypothetical protein